MRDSVPAPVLTHEEQDDGIVLLQAQRPQVRNALNLELAREIAAHSHLAARQVKQFVLESMNTPFDAGLRAERKAFQLMFSSSEKTDRIRAFLG